VPRHGVFPLTGPQIDALGIHFCVRSLFVLLLFESGA
jgi:hypothetical protein